jgi:GTP cyclohydrolase I
MDPEKVLTVTFSDDYDEMIVVKDIPVLSYCAHHVVPFFGKAKVGYVPNNRRITGLSKLARIVDVFAKRLQVQERLTRQVASAINDILKPKGVGVVISASHMCMSHRGVRAVGSETVTSCLIGCMRDEPETRAEFLQF